MRVLRGKTLLLAGAAVTGALLALRTSKRRERRRRILQGDIRPAGSEWTEVGPWRLHVRVALPPRPPLALPVVFVHGMGTSTACFVPVMERLAQNFLVYAPDLPGHGKSDTPAEALDIRRFADALVAWMDAREIPRASLIGNNMGSQIIVDAALRYPERVARLVLIGPTVEPQARNDRELIKRFAIDATREPYSLSALMARDHARVGARLRDELRVMRLDPIEAKLPDITVPVMVVRGEHDAIASQPWVEEVARLADTDHLAVIPSYGHAVHYSAPEEVVAAITPFLLEVRADTQPAAGIGAPPMH